ncbi:putative F-box protein At3g17480 [Humulus lupulus]|uniref:putative F-box protein At3g17480 n=1 Tax=Humulus lupulus TaxID=3486 RepID=UPI002B410323|nr:putative F-box protein At3g17480 [Humulus lupulus]
MEVVCPHLPEEIVVEILQRLPHDSVITSKRVCKSWYDIIKHESFVSNHFHRHLKFDTNTSLLFLHGLNYYKDSLDTISYDHDHDNDHLIPYVVEQSHTIGKLLHFVRGSFFERDRIRGLHCNGIIAFPKQDTEIVFFNPTLKQFKILYTQPLLDFVSIAHGFGYDQRANLYKYVKIFQSESKYSHDDATMFRAQVCTLWINSSGGGSVSSSWRETNIILPIKNTWFDDGVVYLKSVCYWLNLSEKQPQVVSSVEQPQIVSFDMCDEKFSMIPLPSDPEVSITYQRALTVWKDESVTLFIMGKIHRDTFLIIEMWMMVVENDSTYWRKHLTIAPTIGPILEYEFLKRLDFWNQEEFLIEGRNSASYVHIMSYNIRTKRIRRLDFSLEGVELHYSTSYSKSLVSLLNN